MNFLQTAIPPKKNLIFIFFQRKKMDIEKKIRNKKSKVQPEPQPEPQAEWTDEYCAVYDANSTKFIRLLGKNGITAKMQRMGG